ncbi:MAG: hypothetical protein ABRQ37_09215 [Candidatus Eremiobacterota bacterium]
MESIKLSGSTIGNFENFEQVKNYKKTESIKNSIEAMTRDLVTLDDNTDKSHPVYGSDYNFKRPGNVLIDNETWRGTLKFNPSNSQEVKHMEMSNTAPVENCYRNVEQYEFTETENQKIYTHTNTSETGAGYPKIKEGYTLTIDKNTNDRELKFIEERA